nr:PaaI family thioesterase [Sphingomonas sp. BGYR3]
MPAAFDASPIARALGMKIISLCDAGAVVEFSPDGTFLQGAGVMQGGAIAAMLDYAMIVSVMAAMPSGASPATTNLDLVCLRPAPLGAFRAEATIRRRTRSVIFAQADLTLADGTAVATATATNLLKIKAND